MVSPVQTGVLLDSTGAAGVEGLERTIVPVVAVEGHPARLTVMLVYEPAFKPVIITCPEALEVMFTGPCVTELR